MKKKFINGLLLVATLFAATSSFVSCKDYEEDHYVNLQGIMADQNATLQDLINAQATQLKNLRDSINANIKTCKCNFDSSFQIAFTDSMQSYSDSIDAILQRLADLNNQLNSGDSTSVTSQLLNINNDLNEQATSISALTVFMDSIRNGQVGVGRDTTIYVSNDTTIYVTNNNYYENAYNDSALKARLDSVVNAIVGWGDKIAQTALDVKRAQATADADSIRLDQHALVLDTLKGSLSAAQEEIKNHHDSIVALYDNFDKLNTKIDSVADTLTNLINDYKKQMIEALGDSMNVVRHELDSVANAVEERLNGRIDSVINVIDNQIKPELARLDSIMNNHEERISALEDAQKKAVSSVIVQGVYNPVFGSVSLPLGLQTNILAAYYGQNTGTAYQFPGNYDDPELASGLFAYADECEEAIELLQGIDYTSETIPTGLLMSDAANNAGKIYITINPNTTDFAGKEFALVNSLDEESGVKLAVVKKSYDKLTFGWTRSKEDNGFYEAQAYLPAANIGKVKARLNFTNSKAALKKILDEKSRASVVSGLKSFVTDAYGNVQDVMDANAVKTTWTDAYGQHSVYSNYNVAATAIRPLGYNAFDAIPGMVEEYTEVGVDKVEKLIDRLTNKIAREIKKQNISLGLNVNGLESDLTIHSIGELKIEDIDPSKLTMSIPVTVSISQEFKGSGTATTQPTSVSTGDIDTQVDIPSVDIGEQNIDIPTVTAYMPTLVYTYDVFASDVKDLPSYCQLKGGAVNVENSNKTNEDALRNAIVWEDGKWKSEATYNPETMTYKITNTIWLTNTDYEQYKVTTGIDDPSKKQTVTSAPTTTTWSGTTVNPGSVDVTVPGQTINVGAQTATVEITVPVEFTKTQTVDIDLAETLEALFEEVNAKISPLNTDLGKINNTLKQVNDIIKQVNSLEKNLNTKIHDAADNILNRVNTTLHSYIDRAASTFVRYMGKAPRALKPLMLVMTDDSYGIVRGSRTTAPTVNSDEVVLVPTSFTAELLAPAYKKFVAVTNIYDLNGKASKADVQAFNEQNEDLAKVLEGATRNITVKGLEAGKTYEFLYLTVDYTGKVGVRKSYLNR